MIAIAWLSWLLAAWRGRKQIGEAVDAVEEVARGIDAAVHGDEPGQPLPYSAVEEQRRQIERSTSFKVKKPTPAELAQTEPAPDVAPCSKPPAGWYCTRPAGHDGACAAYPILMGEGPSVTKTKAGPPRPPPRKGTK